MILSCPSCGARFKIDADQLGVAGRKVRCAKCSHTWHATPDEDEERRTEQEPPEVASQLAGTADDEADTTDDLPEGPPPFESFEAMRAQMDGGRARKSRAAAPEARRRRSRLRPLAGWVVFLLVIAGILAGGWYGRYQIVDTFPTAARLYELIGTPISTVAPGLEIRNVAASPAVKDDQSLLVIEGRIVNTTDATQPVPALKVTLTDQQGSIVDEWRVAAKTAALAPGDSTSFNTRKPRPDNVRNVSIVFVRAGG